MPYRPAAPQRFRGIISAMPPEIIATPAVPAMNSTYSQAVRHGDVIYLSGQLGVDPSTGILADGVLAQYRQALANIDAILQAAGSSRSAVIKATVFMTDVSRLAELNEIYGAYFGDHRPAKTGVEVARLSGGALIEIEVIAAYNGGQ